MGKIKEDVKPEKNTNIFMIEMTIGAPGWLSEDHATLDLRDHGSEPHTG